MDGKDQVAHAVERAAPNAFAGDLGEPAFGLIEPRRTGGRKVQMIAWPPYQPLLHFWILVDSVVIEHQVDVQSGSTDRHTELCGRALVCPAVEKCVLMMNDGRWFREHD